MDYVSDSYHSSHDLAMKGLKKLISEYLDYLNPFPPTEPVTLSITKIEIDGDNREHTLHKKGIKLLE